MRKLNNYVLGQKFTGSGDGQVLHDAVNGEAIGCASTQGIDFSAVLDYARKTGNPSLGRMTFQQRGLMLKALALHLQKHLPRFYQISYQTGATRADSWVDLEGGIGNLFSYASLRRKLPNESFCIEGDPLDLGKAHSFAAQHILLPKQGVAIHINAFNFPVWGMLEKIAVNLMAGVPAVVKPATLTCFLTEAVADEILASGILPAGALQVVCGPAGDILDHVTYEDAITFTGSAQTGLMLKSNPRVQQQNVSFTMEADSLNCIVLGDDVTPEMAEWDIFIREVKKEITSKAGQKCTAIRRIFVPENKLEDMTKALAGALSQTVIGDPHNEKVRMGSLAGMSQRQEVRTQVQKLLSCSQIIYGSLDSVQLLDADAVRGAFMSPLLLLNEHPFSSDTVHSVEAFGPVSTIMPYKTTEEAIALSRMGRGSLCSSIVTSSASVARSYVMGSGAHHGRILVLNQECAAESTGHGSPLPQLIHGGPGRAGGSEELGGLRGIAHYMQRVALQGSPTMITAISNNYLPHAKQNTQGDHPFRKYFEELRVGDTLVTHKRTITEADIVNFANISWDHFYAHTDQSALEGTMFERPVAHGYFILSAAAGLFVDAKKGPVLLNYGIDSCRFLKPVYTGTTIGVRLTCKEKIETEDLPGKDNQNAGGVAPARPAIASGIVKWYVDVYDQTGDSVAVATILTLVRKREST